MEFHYTKEVWKEVYTLTEGIGKWEVPSLMDGLKISMENPRLVDHKTLPCIVSWSIWIIGNELLLQDKPFTTLEVYHKINLIYEYIYVHPKMKFPKKEEPTINPKGWDFFNGATQRNPGLSVIGVMYINEI